jgi:hypothetical protein
VIAVCPSGTVLAGYRPESIGKPVGKGCLVGSGLCAFWLEYLVAFNDLKHLKTLRTSKTSKTS